MFINLLLWSEGVTRVGRAMYSGILTLILLFTILYMVVSRAILHLSSREVQFKLFKRLVSVPGSRSWQFFYNCGGSPLSACTPAISWQCFWVCGSHTLQAYSRQAQTRVRVRYRVKPLLLHLKVIDVKFKERPFSFYPYFGSLSLDIQDHNSVLAYLSRNNWQ